MASGSWSALFKLFAETTSESHRGDNDGMRAHVYWPHSGRMGACFGSPNLRHAFALISDEVDASLVFFLRYGLNLREFLFDVYMNTYRNWSSYLSP